MNAYIESFKIQIFLYVIVVFVDTIAVLWIVAVYFKTVICLGRDNVKQYGLTTLPQRS
jgi:hypothetical protein